jgi:hypothetical protein
MTLVTRQAMSDDSGLFTDGTALTKSFIDQLYGEIDAQCHSTTNPTVAPKTITDEVVSARGSKASLDARLDVSLEEDGTLKTQASLVTASQVQSGLGSRNVAVNGDLADWTNGGALAPDNFTLTGAGATIARTGPAMGDTFTFGTGGGGFAAKITRAGNDWKLTQDVIAAADFAKFVNVKGQKVSVAVKGKTAVVSLLRIVVDDGATQTASAYHTGGGAEEHLSVTHTISNSATKVSVYVEGTGSNGDAYVGGFMVVFADLAPSDWSPLSIIGDASATSKGVVNLSAQRLGAGTKTADGLALTRGSLSHRVVLAEDLTDHATSGTGATVVWSLAGDLPGGTLLDNETLVIEAHGGCTADANTKTFAVTLGTTATDTSISVATNGANWVFRVRITRVSQSVQRTLTELIITSGAGSFVVSGSAAENLGNTLPLKLTLTHGTSGTTTLRVLRAWIETATV